MRKKRRSHSRHNDGDHEGVDLTPLIDVVFVVLILFIIIAPMVEIDKVQLAQGAKKEQIEKSVINDEKSILIHVLDNNSIMINKREIDAKHLGPILKVLHKKYPKLIPQLYQDKKAFFGTYQKVKNAVEEAGYEELDVILEPSS